VKQIVHVCVGKVADVAMASVGDYMSGIVAVIVIVIVIVIIIIAVVSGAPGAAVAAGGAGRPDALRQPLLLSGAASDSSDGEAHAEVDSDSRVKSILKFVFGIILVGGTFAGLSLGTAQNPFHAELMVFMLAVVIGWHVVWSVTPALHTPLMSVTNAISGIIIIGAQLEFGGVVTSAHTVIAAVSVTLAAINIVGGFYITQRMLYMFHK